MSSHVAERARLEHGDRPGPIASTVRFLRPRTLLIAVITGLVLTAAGAVALLSGGDAERAERQPATPAEASVADLRAIAQEADTPIYWAGTEPGTRFEVTETPGGKVFVRYLPPNVEVSDKRPDFLTVGSYPYRRAYAVAEESSLKEGMARADAPGGGLAVWSKKRPNSIYVAYPGSELLVEVFSPEASEAQRLVLEGSVGPVDATRAGSQVTPPLVPPVDLRP